MAAETSSQSTFDLTILKFIEVNKYDISQQSFLLHTLWFLAIILNEFF